MSSQELKFQNSSEYLGQNVRRLRTLCPQRPDNEYGASVLQYYSFRTAVF
jgi:hypothetical protein